jgi:hypothetical protein
MASSSASQLSLWSRSLLLVAPVVAIVTTFAFQRHKRHHRHVLHVPQTNISSTTVAVAPPSSLSPSRSLMKWKGGSIPEDTSNPFDRQLCIPGWNQSTIDQQVHNQVVLPILISSFWLLCMSCHVM